ncbi:unnamed protein product [Hymenolepis diminuta]|uniref:Protein krueppel n=1 Tax=Hymenolepis diminuta TaxID=6216 RepID=A0A0R3SKT9_HYMDI|nr:unnamed protein product [Hymenolepis diminuta]
MANFTIRKILGLPDSPPVLHEFSNSEAEIVRDVDYTPAGGENERLNDDKYSMQSQSTQTDSGVGTASTSALEGQLQSNQENTSLVAPSSATATTSTPLNNRNPERLSQVVQTPGSSVVRHRRVKLDRKMNECSYCHKRFDRPSLLNRHIRTHTGERPFPCSHCNSRFATKGALVDHERTHTGERPYICKHCGKGFQAASNCCNHVKKIHMKISNHRCTECGASFLTPGILERHRYSHTGNFPFICAVCAKGFPTELRLRSHEYVHSKEKPYKCNLCSSAFTTKGSLKAHINRKHGKFSTYKITFKFCSESSEEKTKDKLAVGETNTSNILPTPMDLQQPSRLKPAQENIRSDVSADGCNKLQPAIQTGNYLSFNLNKLALYFT